MVVLEDSRLLGEALNAKFGDRVWTEPEARHLAGELGMDRVFFDIIADQEVTYERNEDRCHHWKLSRLRGNQYRFSMYSTKPGEVPLAPLAQTS